MKYANQDIQLSLGSRVKKSVLGKNVKIGRSFVNDSTIGNNVSVGDSCYIGKSCLEDRISIGSRSIIHNTSIGKFTYTAGDLTLKLVDVGRFCSIGSQLICGTGEHPTDFSSTHPVFFSTFKQCGTSFTNQNLFDEQKKITIGHDVWIGARVFIRDGITIGNGAIVGAGSVVVKNVPDYAIVGGVPAKVIRFRFSPDIIQKLQVISWWNFPEDKLRELQQLFAQKDIQLFIDWYDKTLLYSLYSIKIRSIKKN